MMRSRVKRIGAAAVFGACVAGCSSVIFQTADEDPDGVAASPPALGAFQGEPAVETLTDWTARRAPRLRQTFARHVFGEIPSRAPYVLQDRTVIDPEAFEGAGVLEVWTIAPDGPDGAGMDEARALTVAVALPAGADGPAPVVVTQSFCPTRDVVGRDEIPPPRVEGPDCTSAFWSPIIRAVFGAHIMTPPFQTILERGYAVATYYAAELAPDSGGAGLEKLRAMAEERSPARWGAVAAWADAYSAVVDVMDLDPRFDRNRTAVWGHSRNGKSALWAAANDPRIDLVISHQSGTGGASLARDGIGEPIAEITEAYPHWFTPAYATYAGREADLPVDQHQLVALVAPRPLLLGNAKRDVWSDPQGAFAAARGADPVYELYGAAGLDQPDLVSLNVAAPLAFYMRNGRHGVTRRDWRVFLDFLDAHFKA